MTADRKIDLMLDAFIRCLKTAVTLLEKIRAGKEI